MFRIAAKTTLVLALASAALFAPATLRATAAETALYASLGPDVSVPFGWLDFCQRYRGECDNDASGARDIDLTAKAYKEIQRINAWVNHSIEPVSDMDHWGVVDQWDYPTDGKGDCEDFALLKRRMLAERGFPRQALLMTVVKEKNGDGHAVLTVKTNRGEFVLDNMNDAIKPWTMTPYRFVKRQSQENQNVWVAIGDPTSAPLYVSK
ncbi:MAG: transglutaminase [Methylocystaceae bacterium]|nr:MAG: transglutaminase [Methylocystaceae bacterium]